MKLNEIKIGQTVVIDEVGGNGSLRQHFLDMGVIPGTEITLIKYAPMGDPMQLRLHGYELTLRLDDAKQISVIPVEKTEKPKQTQEKKSSVIKAKHPGFGEEHKSKKEGLPVLKEDELVTFALAGNQNCGKTTLFNQLTGSNQHVGNFPGVTVDQKDGEIKGHPHTLITDLPGIYSLSPYTSEEIVSRKFILEQKPKAIINIVDATNIERNLYLTMQLMELDVPMVLALNMMDEMAGNGGHVHINKMEQYLGIPVVPISAAKNEGISELVEHAMHVARYQEPPQRQDFCDANENGGSLHRAIHAVMHLSESHCQKVNLPKRFAATKLIEGDERIKEALQLSEHEELMLEQIICQMEEELGLDRSAAVAQMRFSFIQNMVDECVIKPKESKESKRSNAVDKLLTGKYTAIPCFVLIIALVFWLTFNVIGAWLQGLFEIGVDWITQFIAHGLASMQVNETLQSLILDGIVAGVGSVISFLPIIVTLFFFLSLLEDSGYMARIAFIMDKPLRKIGLSGRSIVPMLIGFGCSVPAVMSSRTLPSQKDRKLTVLLIPFMSCTAKLPIYGFLIQAFFPQYSGLIMVGVYFLGIAVGILVALIYKKLFYKSEAVPFVMELPNYRMPAAKNVVMLLWEKANDFIQRAFSVILVATVVIWFLQSFDLHLNWVADPSTSILAKIAGFVAPIFAPLGFGDWRAATALVTGFLAKESVVSTLNVLYGTTANFSVSISAAAGAALLVFCLLYTPCVAAVASIKREMGSKGAFKTVLLQCSVAWIVSFIVYNIVGLLI
jgi:ferrous iron transport protein B